MQTTGGLHRSCRCRMMVGSLRCEPRSRVQTRQAGALSLSAAVSTGTMPAKAVTYGLCCCACPISDWIDRAIGGKAGSVNVISTRRCGRRPRPASNRLLKVKSA